MKPGRGICILKRVETSETLPGARILIPQSARERLAADQYEVLAVGGYEYCDDEDCGQPHDGSHDTRIRPPWKYWQLYHATDPHVRRGAWILAEPRSLIDAGDGTFFVRQSQIAGVFVETEEIP